LVVVIPYIHKKHENYLKPAVEKIPEKAGLKKTKIKRYNKEAFYQLNPKKRTHRRTSNGIVHVAQR
jgi:hypothetical protein